MTKEEENRKLRRMFWAMAALRYDALKIACLSYIVGNVLIDNDELEAMKKNAQMWERYANRAYKKMTQYEQKESTCTNTKS